MLPDHEPPEDRITDPPSDGASQRLDKWLWFARVIKSRTQAAALVTGGKVRVNRQRTDKPSQSVKPGDAVTITVRGHIRVLKILAPGIRRGPPAEAKMLYDEVQPATITAEAARRGTPVADGNDSLTTPHQRIGEQQAVSARRPSGSGRPTKRDRRLTDNLRDEEL